MNNAPPPYLPVLLGHGSFLRDRAGNIRRDELGQPLYIMPPNDQFLEMKPSPESRQQYPFQRAERYPNENSLVLLALSTNVDCRNPDLITEIGYTVFDTAAIYTGAKTSPWRKKALPGCEAPGLRGQNVAKLSTTRHFIIRDTAHHHPETCPSPHHTAQPYHFSFRKSTFIDRDEIAATLENAYKHAERENLTAEQVAAGYRRKVVLLLWGDCDRQSQGDDDADNNDDGTQKQKQPQNLHPVVKRTRWYSEKRFYQSWDVRLYELARRRFARSSQSKTPSLLAHLDAFGVNHKAHGVEIGHNAGNKTAFAIRLLLSYSFLTEEERATVLRGRENLRPEPAFPGVEAVLARDNRPPGSGPLPRGRVPFPLPSTSRP